MSFAVDVSKFATGAADKLERTRRGVVIGLFGAVIRDTPVLTGRLRGNWQSSVASPLTGEIPRIDPSGSAATADAVSAANAVKGDQPVFLRNNLPYAYRIEFDGWSKHKAPAGMLRRNVTRFQQLVAQKAREAKP